MKQRVGFESHPVDLIFVYPSSPLLLTHVFLSLSLPSPFFFFPFLSSPQMYYDMDISSFIKYLLNVCYVSDTLGDKYSAGATSEQGKVSQFSEIYTLNKYPANYCKITWEKVLNTVCVWRKGVLWEHNLV